MTIAVPSIPIEEKPNKVPEVTAVFWIIKMMSTTVGETGADLLIFKLHLGLVITAIVMVVPLLAALGFQLHSRRCIPSIYWSTVVFVSIFGTLATDILTDKMHVALPLSSFVFSCMLISVFLSWRENEKTLSIRSINNLRREIYYWAAILVTFALGTAIGDLISEDMNVGYLHTALIFFGLIVLTGAVRFVFPASSVATFWIAYILTRPLGASCGDLLAKSIQHGGLGFGTVNTSIVFFLVIIALVIYLEYRSRVRPA